jgi:hypothetical protein
MIDVIFVGVAVVFCPDTDFSKREGTEITSTARLAIKESKITFMCYLCKYHGIILTFKQFSIEICFYQKTPKIIKESTRLSCSIYPYLQVKEQMLKHHSVMVDILDKFEVLEKRQKKVVAKKLIDSGMYVPK